MVSPNLSKKEEKTLSIAYNTRKLFQTIYKKQENAEKIDEEVPKIIVSDLISKMAFYYEKIRNYVDYNEEHLHRKNAIVRILKRLIVIEGATKIDKSEEISRQLLHELIRAGYLPNNRVPEGKIDEVNEILDKHIKLRNQINPRFSLENEVEKIIKKEKREISTWLIKIMASEIESILERDIVEEMVVSNMYENLASNIKLPTNFKEFEKDLNIQIYLGIHRTFLKFDSDMLSFILFKYFNSNWWNPSDEDISKIAKNIDSLKKAIDRQLNHSLTKQLDRVINRYAVYHMVLVDMISEDPAEVYQTIKEKPDAFPGLVKNTFSKRFERAKSKLWRAGINSIVYIFITKTIFAVILEVPAIRYFDESLNPVSLAINICFPAFLLFLIIAMTRISSENNAKKITEGVGEITFDEKKRTDPIILRKPIKRGIITGTIFGFIYFCTYFISFGVVVWALKKINFNWVSISIFLFFLAFVSFFSIRIRRSVRQLVVVEEKENLLTFLVDFFFIPIVGVGKWLSQKFSKLNVFIFILDFIIEAPFKVFVEIAEQWTRYVKERRDDIV